MTQSDFGRAPAGWYPDPLGLPQMRWWDNVAWTQDVSEARQPMVMRETSEKRFAWADDEPPTRRERRERRRAERAAERSTVDTWRPSAEALLELEPPRPVGRSDAFESPAAPAAPAEAAEAPAASTPAAPAFEPRAARTAPQEQPLQAGPEVDIEQFFHWEEPDPTEEFAGFATASTHSAGHRSMNYGRQWPREETSHQRQAETFDPASWHQTATEAPSAAPASVWDRQTAPTTISTGPVWAIALLPILHLLLGLIFVTTFEVGDDFAFIAALWLAVYIAVVVLAICDRHLLVRSGHGHPAHWGWSLLGAPAYLIARAASASRESGRGFGPLVVWGMLAMLHAAAVIAVPGLVISAAPTVFSAQAEQSIISDASWLGVDTEVSCPSVPPNLIGEQFTCTTVVKSGESAPVTVSLQRLNGWIDWRIDGWGIWTPGEVAEPVS